jgi:hypothetical protein
VGGVDAAEVGVQVELEGEAEGQVYAQGGTVTIHETPAPATSRPIGGAEVLAVAGILAAATQALGGALGSMALGGGVRLATWQFPAMPLRFRRS